MGERDHALAVDHLCPRTLTVITGGLLPAHSRGKEQRNQL
jgi:hypothetical protein